MNDTAADPFTDREPPEVSKLSGEGDGPLATSTDAGTDTGTASGRARPPGRPRSGAANNPAETQDAARPLEEYWECDPPPHPSGNPERFGEWNDDSIQSHYLDQVGEETLCLCGHDAGRHGWLRGSTNSICLDCYHGTYHGVPEGCTRFVASPYSCPICNAGLLSVDEAIACCICLSCGHRYAGHRHKRPNSIVNENGPCHERWCRCPGFGGVRASEARENPYPSVLGPESLVEDAS